MQLARADTLLFEFAFWPTINISKNRHRDGFLFSFHLFFFFFLIPSARQTAIYPGHQFLSSLIFPSSLWLSGASICTNATGEQPPFCAPSRAQTIPSSLELLRVTLAWRLLLTPAETLLLPCWMALGSPRGGQGWEALPTGNSSIKGRWKRKPVEAGIDGLCAAEEALMGSLSAAGHPGDSLPASVC